MDRVELPPEQPQWDGSHETSVPGSPADDVAYAVCTCSWVGEQHRGPDRRWQATADADEHDNAQDGQL